MCGGQSLYSKARSGTSINASTVLPEGLAVLPSSMSLIASSDTPDSAASFFLDSPPINRLSRTISPKLRALGVAAQESLGMAAEQSLGKAVQGLSVWAAG